MEFFKTNVQLFYISKINWLRVSYFHRYYLPIKKEETENKQNVQNKAKKKFKKNNNNRKKIKQNKQK